MPLSTDPKSPITILYSVLRLLTTLLQVGIAFYFKAKNLPLSGTSWESELLSKVLLHLLATCVYLIIEVLLTIQLIKFYIKASPLPRRPSAMMRRYFRELSLY